jgi:hypothetical protein
LIPTIGRVLRWKSAREELARTTTSCLWGSRERWWVIRHTADFIRWAFPLSINTGADILVLTNTTGNGAFIFKSTLLLARIFTDSYVACNGRNLWTFWNERRVVTNTSDLSIAIPLSFLAGAGIFVCANPSRDGATILECALLTLHGARIGNICGRGHGRARGWLSLWARLLPALLPFARLVSTKSASGIVWADNVGLRHGGEVRKRSEEPNQEVGEAHHFVDFWKL